MYEVVLIMHTIKMIIRTLTVLHQIMVLVEVEVPIVLLMIVDITLISQ